MVASATIFFCTKKVESAICTLHISLTVNLINEEQRGLHP